MAFSSGVKLGDLDDFISLSQDGGSREFQCRSAEGPRKGRSDCLSEECVKPLIEAWTVWPRDSLVFGTEAS